MFELAPSGHLTTLYNFCSVDNCADGQYPDSLVQATNGNFYGTTPDGGLYNNLACGNEWCGTVFEMTPAGGLTTIYSFCALTACADGAGPTGLMQSTDGTFYGTAFYGGNSIFFR